MLSNVVETMDVNNTKITIVISSYYNGGSENFGINISQYLSKFYKVSLLSLKNFGILKEKIELSENLESVNFGMSKNRYKLFKVYKFLKDKKIVFSVMRDSNIFCLISGLFIPGLKVIIREGNRVNKLNFVYTLFLNILYLRATKIIVNSIDIKKDLEQRFFLLKKKIKIYYNPINSYSHKPKDKKSEKIILNIARMHKQKNHFLLLESFSKCLEKNKNIKLILVGNGPEEKSIKEKIEILKLRNYVSIIESTNNLNEIFFKADLYVHTSFYEGFPNVIAESIANRIYCISTPSSSSLKDIILDSKYGYILKTFDQDELSNQILKSLNLSGFDNSKFIDKFFINNYGTNFLNLFK